MSNQLTSNAEALRLFFTEPIYLVNEQNKTALVDAVKVADMPSSVVIPIQNQETLSVPAPAEAVKVPEPIVQKEWQFEFLGKNQKGILILVNDQINKVSTPQGTELLRKLVKAIELTNNDFALVNYASYATAKFADFKQFFSCKLVLSFGVESTHLGLTAQPLHQLAKQQEVELVFTSNLHELDSDQASKKVLWATLQQLKS